MIIISLFIQYKFPMRCHHCSLLKVLRPIPVYMGAEGAPTPAQAILDTSWVSYNVNQFWHYPPGDSIRFHRFRAQSHKAAIPKPLLATCILFPLPPSPGAVDQVLHDGLQAAGSNDPL